jgi:ROS/MUCR transcriptional regulator protein
MPDSNLLRVTPEELASCQADIRKARALRSPDHIVCLECGRALKRISAQHLREHAQTQAQYKTKWGYNSGSGLASDGLSKKRTRVAKKMGLAKRGSRFLKPFPRGHRGFFKSNREAALNRSEAQSHESRPSRWKKSKDGDTSDFAIAEQRLRGSTQAVIAKRAGLSETAVYWRLKRLGFPGRPCIFEHGGPKTGKAIHDLLEAFKVTPLELTKSMGISRNALYPHMRHPDKVLSPDLAKAIQTQRRSLQTRRPATRAGGRPTHLLPAELRSLPEKYRALRDELKLLRAYLSEGGSARSGLQDWMCRQVRVGAIRSLLFWPEFFRLIDSATLGSAWRPSEVAIHFLASDYEVSDKTIARIVQSGK